MKVRSQARAAIAAGMLLLLVALTAACGGGGAQAVPVTPGGTTPDTTSSSAAVTTSAPVLQSKTNANPIPITVTFSEPVTGFDLTDVVVVGHGKGNLAGSGTTYTFDVTPVGDPVGVTVDVAAGAAQDAAGNASLAPSTFAVTYDSTFQPLDNPPTLSNIGDKLTNQDTTLEFVLFTADEGSDPAEDPQTLSVAGLTSSDQTLVLDVNITATFTDNGDGGSGELTIVPEPGQVGTVTLTVTVTDGNSTAVDTFNVTINPVVEPPTAYPVNASTAQNTAVAFALVASDPSHAIASWTIDTQPLHGTLSGTAPNLTYTPGAGYSGRDSFTYYATDASAENSNLAIVTLIVNGSADFIVGDPVAVAGGDTVNYPGDVAVYSEIQALGFAVNLVIDTDVSGAAYGPAEAALVDLLVISSSVGSGNIASAFQSTPTPIMTWERNLYDAATGFGMTGATGSDDGTVSTTQIEIVDSGHPLAGGLANGIYTVFGGAENLVWAEVSPAAEVVAEVDIGGGVFKPVLFVYEKNDVMQGGITAPAKRVAYFLPDNGVGALTADALSLLHGAINETLAR